MANKDFREIQVSSSLLVVIFLGVLALGVFIFLLGVSVGKKEAGAGTPTQVVTQQIPEPVKEPPVKPAASDTGAGAETSNPAATSPLSSPTQTSTDPAASRQPAKEPVVEKPAAPAPKPATETKRPASASSAAPSGSGLYYVQVAAYTERSQAQAQVDKCKKLGFAALVSNPRAGETPPRYRVRLGGYPTRDRALEALNKFKAAVGKTDAYVLKD